MLNKNILFLTLVLLVIEVAFCNCIFADGIAAETVSIHASDNTSQEIDWFGDATAIHNNRIIVGARYVNKAYLYTTSEQGVRVETLFEAFDDAVSYQGFGSSVAISDNYIVIGAPGDNSFTGAIYIYNLDDMGQWTGTKLTAQETSSSFGHSVSIFEDTLVVGARGAGNNGDGAAYIFRKDSNGIWQQIKKLTPNQVLDTCSSSRNRFGVSVSISGDLIAVGDTCDYALGATEEGNTTGEVFLYEYKNNEWELASKLAPDNVVTGDAFGHSLDISDNKILIGSYRYGNSSYSNEGAAYLYTRTETGEWAPEQISNPVSGSNQNFGISVDIHGETFVIGTTSNVRNVYYYQQGGSGEWDITTLRAEQDGSIGGFGASVSLDESTVIIGARSPGTVYPEDFGRIFLYDLLNLNYISMNMPPTADAGENQSLHLGEVIYLDGTGSSDLNTPSAKLFYAWRLIESPEGSNVSLASASTSMPSFTPDLPGDYLIGLIVTDEGNLASLEDTVLISHLNSPPTADAGSSQATYVGNMVELSGIDSSDANGDVLTYNWALVYTPTESTTIFNDSTSVSPSFVPDLAGEYTISLVVNDGYDDSDLAEVIISVITTEQFAQGQIVQAIDLASELDTASFTAKGDKKAIIKSLQKVLKELQKDKSDKAIKKLTDTIERTDGCALRGSSDINGMQPIQVEDFIVNCEDQDLIYPLLINALNATTP